MSTKTKFNLFQCNHMFHSYSILNPTFPTPWPYTFPSYAIELYNPKLITNVLCVCVQICHFFHIRDRKYRIEIYFGFY